MKDITMTTKAKINLIIMGILVGLISRAKLYEQDRKRSRDPVTIFFTTVVIRTVKVKRLIIIGLIMWGLYKLTQSLPFL